MAENTAAHSNHNFQLHGGDDVLMRVLAKDGSVHELDHSEILFFSIHKSEISVYTAHQEFVLPTTFEQLLHAYADLDFARVDRSFIVNLAQLGGYDQERQSVYFADGKFVPVSERHQKKVLGYLSGKEPPSRSD
ncbi:LytTR family transcriptional regulator [Paenibacillus athensensis]|uniref:HTH LytTR-type domain-containing protein n=1 Tax=Paenibacillus athensensis TaxID=1967502 RepID=A0A4Y8Q1E1_9BACL|nr:LytTR family DNA-binding domain-containing protein [Paenibacillus athensensis]MCD1261097.1 LytTR family transcriptional regulator [Paenibacillus athensensis]